MSGWELENVEVSEQQPQCVPGASGRPPWQYLDSIPRGFEGGLTICIVYIVTGKGNAVVTTGKSESDFKSV